LITLKERDWDYRLRLKGNLTVFGGAETAMTAACAEKRTFYLEDVELTARRVRTHIGIIHDPDHPELWIIAMSERPGYLRTLDALLTTGSMVELDRSKYLIRSIPYNVQRRLPAASD